MKRKLIYLALVLAVVASAYFSVRTPQRKILVIGVDGVDWRVAEPLINAGLMPNLERLRKEGSWGDLMTLNDLPLSPVIWTSIATGKVPAKHKITWFLVDGPDGKKVPVGSHDRAVEAIWNISAKHGKNVGVVGWWATAPAEDVGDGVIISDALGYHGFGSSGQGLVDEIKTHPPQLYPEMAALIPPVQQVGYSDAQRFFDMTEEEYAAEAYSPSIHSRPNARNPIHLFQEYLSTTLGYTKVTERLLDKFNLDMLLVYYEATDSMSHLFMKYAPPRLPWIKEEEYLRYHKAVDEYYVLADEEIGKLLAKVSDDWTVVVLSDHGFRSGSRRPKSVHTIDVQGAHLDHEPEGIFVIKGPGIRVGEKITGANVMDICPTLLHLLDIPVATDMDGRVLDQVFDTELRKKQIEYVATHENPEGRSISSPLPTQRNQDAFRANDAIARLQTLGYISSKKEATQHPHPHDDPAATNAPSKSFTQDSTGAATTVEQIANLARIHLRNGDIASALESFLKIIQLHPENADAWVQVGQIRLYQGRPGEALRCFIQALNLDPNNVAVLMQLAELKARQGRLGEAVEHYNQVISLQDRLAGPYIGLGDALQRLGRLSDAKRVLTHASELDPSSFHAKYNLGVVHLRLGELAKAKKLFEAALEILPNSAIAKNNLAQVAVQQEDEKLAIRLLKEAAELDPNHLESRYNVGVLLLKSGSHAEALEWFVKALAINPQMTTAMYQAAVSQLFLNDVEGAKKRLGVLVRLDQRHVDGWILLGRIAARADNKEAAISYLSQAIRLKGRDLAKSLRTQPDFQNLPWPTLNTAPEASNDSNSDSTEGPHPVPPPIPIAPSETPDGGFR